MSSDAYVILGLPESNLVWTTRLIAAERGLAARLAPAAPHTPEVSAIHPLGKIPCLVHGDRRLFESRAIAGYLDAAPGPGPRLLPADPFAAAAVEQWVALALTTFDPVIIRACLFAMIFPQTQDGAPDFARIASAMPAALAALDALEAALARDGGRLLGREVSLADVFLGPILFYARLVPALADAIAARPHVTGWLDRLLDRPAWRETRPPPLNAGA